MARQMSTSDLPWLMGAAVGRATLPYFTSGASELLKIARIENEIVDFREQQRGRAGDFPALLKLSTEYSEIQHAPISEEYNSFKIERYARQFKYSFVMAKNDDLGGLDLAARTAGLAAATLEGKLLADRLNAGRTTDTLRDGVAIFHATRGNLATTAATPNVTSITAGIAAVRTFKGVNGTDYLNIKPKYLACSPDWEMQARIVVESAAVVVGDRSEDNTPIRGMLEVVVDANLTASSGQPWFLFADPTLTPVLVLGRLSENGLGPVVETKDDWDTDAIAIKARHCCASAWIDYRAYANAGAAS